MDYPSARKFLYGLRYHGAKYGLERMERFVELLGHPERAYPIIHVAGTNGKGSTCAMLEAIFRHAGYRTGLFISPHLVRQGERIQVNRTILEEDAIAQYTTEMRAVAEEQAAGDPQAHPSFFEFMAAMGLLHFKREAVDIAILETGLGGRLDATNVVDPAISVITSISYDHTEILGDTLEKIAFEKAGILKPNRPVVIGQLPEEAEQVIRKVAQERGCVVHAMRERFPEVDALPHTSLAGDYQRLNAGTATLAAEVLAEQFELSSEGMRKGLMEVEWPGRWQRLDLSEGKTLILDATHNPEGALVLDQNLEALRRLLGGERLTLLCGTLGEARAEGLMPVVARHAKELVLLKPNQPRATEFDVLKQYIPEFFQGTVRESTIRAEIPFPGAANTGAPGETIVATGSIYLIGEILEALQVPAHESTGDHALQDLP